MKLAKEKNIKFEQVTLTIGSAPKMIILSFGEIKMSADFIEEKLARMKNLVNPDAPVILAFKKAYTATGYDFKQFTKQLGIEIGNGEVEQ